MARRWLILRGATPSAIRQYRGLGRRSPLERSQQVLKMFVLIRQHDGTNCSLTILRRLNATIVLGNIGPNLWGFGGWGLRLGPGSRGRDPALILFRNQTSMM